MNDHEREKENLSLLYICEKELIPCPYFRKRGDRSDFSDVVDKPKCCGTGKMCTKWKNELADWDIKIIKIKNVAEKLFDLGAKYITMKDILERLTPEEKEKAEEIK